MKKNLIVLLSETAVTSKQIQLELERHTEFQPYFVTNEEAFVRALERVVPDLVVIDDGHPTVSLEKAMILLEKHRADVPFVILGSSEWSNATSKPFSSLSLTIKSLLPPKPAATAKPVSLPDNVPEVYRVISETTSDFIWACRIDGTLVYANMANHRMLSHVPSILIGGSLFSLVHPEDLTQFKASFKSWFAGNTPNKEDVFRLRRKNKTWHPVRVIAANTDDQKHPLSKLFIIARSVAEPSQRNTPNQNRSANLLSKLASQGDYAFVVIDKNYRIRAFNTLAKEWGNKVSGKDLQKGESIYDYIFDKAIGKFNERIEEAFRGTHVFYESKVAIPGGGEIWFELHYAPVFGKEGNVVGVSLSYRSIKQGSKAVPELETSQQYIQALVKSTADITIILDTSGIINHVSFSSETILGFKPVDLVGQNILHYVHTDDNSFLKKAIQAAISLPQKGAQCEFRFQNQTRSWTHLDAELKRLSNEPRLANKIILNARNITERKLIEEALKVRDRAIEASLNGVIITDARQKDNPIIYVNPAFEKMTGYNTAEVAGKNPRFLHGDDREQIERGKLAEAIKNGSPWTGTLRNYRKDGSIFWNELTISPIRDERNILTHFVGIKTDITERIRADEELLQTNGMLRAISEIQSAFIADMEPGTLFKSILDRLLSLTGSEYGFIGEVVRNDNGTPDLKIYSMQDDTDTLSNLAICKLDSKSCQKCGRLSSICQDVLATSQPIIATGIEIESKHICLPQASKQIDHLLALPLFSGEELIGISVIVNRQGGYDDPLIKFLQPFLSTCGNIISAYRASERHLIAEERLREQAALLDITEEAILVRDLKGQILFWNHGAEKVYGWKPDEAIGKNMGSFISLRNDIDYKKAELEILEKGSWSGELSQVTKSGERIVIESSWTLMPSKDGNPKSILIVNTDVTVKKKFEVHLLRNQRMEGIGRLASGIAHDLNNVLSPIILSMQILKKKTTDPKIKSLVSTLETSAHRGANLVKRLLSFARGAEGERVPVQIRPQIEEIGKLLNQTFPKNITINMDVPKNLWMVNGDATQLHQVLLNLCVNSRDAMDSNAEGMINISATNVILDEGYCRLNPEAKPDNYLKITVTDTGSGIPSEILDNIYEPFFTTKAPGHGTGLGLSTVFSIVKSHNGFITVYSEVGKGTAFHVYLPAVDASDEHIDESHQIDFPRGKGELILIVDDESIIREVAKEALESFGYEVITASDGGDAVSEYLKHTQKIAAVLLDVMMPNVDGISCMHALKKLSPDLKIIITSGLGTNKSVLDNPVATNCKFLEKPFTVDSLIKILQDVLSQ